MDVVVTVPKGMWEGWLAEGDLAGLTEPGQWDGENVYGFCFGPGASVPDVAPGDRVYVVAHGKVRGYSPLVEIAPSVRFGGRPGGFALVRRNDAVAVTIPLVVRGFQGWRYCWWNRAAEEPFPDWQTP